jgi:hypothetical protein
LFVSKFIRFKKYRPIIFPVVLCGYENLYLIAKEEHGLRLFVNGVLRETFGFNRHKVMGNWKTLCNEELHDLYSSSKYLGDQIKYTER